MRSGRLVWVEDPKPKPVSASKWVPLAQKHGMCIDFENRCVSHVHGVYEFWGDCFAEQDVGACVVKVAKMIKVRQSIGVAA